MSKKCPICGKDNGCAFNTGQDPKSCWCMKTTIPKELLEGRDGSACICKSCVEAYYKSHQKKICVIGSLNIDILLTVDKFPKAGQTIRASSSQTKYGGKGGNQAVVSAGFNSQVSILACLGKDYYGDDYCRYLEGMKVRTHLISRVDEETGKAIIEVDQAGENKIITSGGANNRLSKAFIQAHQEEILDHDIYLMSLSNPKEVTLYLMKLLKSKGKTIILDPGPSENFDMAMLNYIDIITPNETELKNEMLESSVITILKKGAMGSEYHSNIVVGHQGYQVNTLDTVGAGDAFNAALAYGYLYEFEPLKLLQFANASGALATTAKGAQGCIPSLEQIFTLKNLNQVLKINEK